MVAMRTAERPNLPISTLEDVLEHKEWAFGFVGAALERNYFEAAEESTLWGKLWKSRVQKDARNLVGDVFGGLKRALESRFVFMGFYWPCQEILRANLSLEKSCSLHVTGGEYYFKGGLAVGLTKNSPYREAIDYRLMQFRESGLLDHMESENMPRSFACPEPPFSPITLKEVAPALILLLIGVIISVILLFIEILWFRINKSGHNIFGNRLIKMKRK